MSANLVKAAYFDDLKFTKPVFRPDWQSLVCNDSGRVFKIEVRFGRVREILWGEIGS